MVALTHWVCFLFFLRELLILCPHLSVVFRRLVHLASFPACWRQANITPIPKGPPSSSVPNYRPISITSVLSMVFDPRSLFVLDDLWNALVCYQPPSLLIVKVWVPVIHFCAYPIHAECFGEWAEVRIVKIDLSAVFNRVYNQGILYKLCSVGTGGSVLSILTQFLLNRSQYVMVNGCRSKLVNVVSGVAQGSVLSQLLFLLYTSEFFPFWKIS